MIAASRPEEARLAALARYAESAYKVAAANGAPMTADLPPDPRLAPDWTVCGVITGQDAIFGRTLELLPRRVPYGWLLRRSRAAGTPPQFALAIRGTESIEEWAIDAEILQSSVHPAAGRVESGFWSVYSTLELRAPGTPGGHDLPLISAVTTAVGSGSLLVVGHSLGAAVSLYASVDFADPNRLGKRVEALLIACPKPGDGLFCQYASARISKYAAYAAPLDIVPHVPEGFGYESLPGVTELPTSPLGFRIKLLPGCQHQMLSYEMRLDPGSVNIDDLPVCDLSAGECIRKLAPR